MDDTLIKIKIIEKILKSPELTKTFLKFKNLEDIYPFLKQFNDSLTLEDWKIFLNELRKAIFSIVKLDDKKLSSVIGGSNITKNIKKFTGTGLSVLMFSSPIINNTTFSADISNITESSIIIEKNSINMKKRIEKIAKKIAPLLVTTSVVGGITVICVEIKKSRDVKELLDKVEELFENIETQEDLEKFIKSVEDTLRNQCRKKYKNDITILQKAENDLTEKFKNFRVKHKLLDDTILEDLKKLVECIAKKWLDKNFNRVVADKLKISELDEIKLVKIIEENIVKTSFPLTWKSNSCFFNSVIQQLIRMPEFLDFVVKSGYNMKPKHMYSIKSLHTGEIREERTVNREDTVTFNLYKIIENIYTHGKQEKMHKFVQKVRKLIDEGDSGSFGDPFSTYTKIIAEVLKENSKTIQFGEDPLLTFVLTRSYSANKQRNIISSGSSQRNLFLSLAGSLEKTENIQEMINKNNSEFEIEGMEDASLAKIVYLRAPQHLVIKLNRTFGEKMFNFSISEINETIELPVTEIDESKAPVTLDDLKKLEKKTKYNLCGAIVQSPSHITSYRKHDDDWYFYDDMGSKAQKLSPQELEKVKKDAWCGGKDKSKMATMLFYEKIN